MIRERRWRALWPLAGAGMLLALAFVSQRSQIRPQPFFTTIDPEWEQVIRMRTAYDWIDLWPSGSVISFLLFGAVACGAVWRIRTLTTWTQRVFLMGFPLLGVASIAASAFLLDHWKWALMAQVQPARATLFTIVFAQINCGLAALVAARERRRWEALLWFIPVLIPPVNPLFAGSYTSPQITTIALLTLIAGSLALLDKMQWIAVPAVVLVGCWAIPHYAGTVNYPELHSTELDQLSDWARTNTPVKALFVFPASGRKLEQGVFRVKALRSLYTDWKAGGQVNYFRDFALDWRQRWQDLSSGKLTTDDWRTRGVDYLVYAGPRVERLGLPVYQNARYRAYEISSGAKRNAP